MHKYTVWFEIFGKKMKTTIHAKTAEEVKQKLWEKIIVYKVERDESDNSGFESDFFNIFGMKP
jgi:hypothetical protein